MQNQSEKSSLEQRVESLEEKIDALIGLVVSISKTQVATGKTIDSNFDILNQKIDNLSKMSSKEFGNIKIELKKIQDVSGYSEEYENLLRVS